MKDKSQKEEAILEHDQQEVKEEGKYEVRYKIRNRNRRINVSGDSYAPQECKKKKSEE